MQASICEGVQRSSSGQKCGDTGIKGGGAKPQFQIKIVFDVHVQRCLYKCAASRCRGAEFYMKGCRHAKK